jgi:hypothetical protein
MAWWSIPLPARLAGARHGLPEAQVKKEFSESAADAAVHRML